MTTPNVLIPFYDDLERLKRAVESVPNDLTVYAVDGRYQTFPGETNLTPGAEEWCDSTANVRYCAPDEGRLPWGIELGDRHPYTRYDQHAEARYTNYELLPADEWVLKLDTDERLVVFDRSAFDDLDPLTKYTPAVSQPDGEKLYPHRVYVPENWTFWVDDVMFPREFYPRDTPVEELARAQQQTNHNRANHGGLIEEIGLLNEGKDRPSAYLERRQEHLVAMGRTKRAGEYDDLI